VSGLRQGTRTLVAGLDGCRAGWVLATAPALESGVTLQPGDLQVGVVTDLREVVRRLNDGDLAAAAIDIPIGLAPDGPRPVDREARRRIGERRSSVFPAPVRSVLAAQSYADACAISRSVCARGVSRQLFAILDKIREVDELESPALQDRLFEMHPEVSFTELAGAPMRFHKSTDEGRNERLDALRRAFPGHALDAVTGERLRGAQPDDVLDALVGAWTAGRYVARRHVQLGGDVDGTGLRMEMIA